MTEYRVASKTHLKLKNSEKIKENENLDRKNNSKEFYLKNYVFRKRMFSTKFTLLLLGPMRHSTWEPYSCMNSRIENNELWFGLMRVDFYQP